MITLVFVEKKVSHFSLPNIRLLSPLPYVHALFFSLSFNSLLDSSKWLLVFSSELYVQIPPNLLCLVQIPACCADLEDILDRAGSS